MTDYPTTPTTPIPDRLAPQVMPGGRGTQTHGVKPTDPWQDPPRIATEVAEFAPEEPQPEPVPVRVVTESARELKSWRVLQVIVGNSPTRIVGAHDGRKKVQLRNISAGSDVLIAPDSGVSVMSGWLLGQVSTNENITIETDQEVWGVLADSTDAPAMIHVLVEFAQPI